MKLPLAFVALSLLLAFHWTQADNERQLWTAVSPDKKFFAAGRIVPDPQLVYRSDLDGFRLVIYSGSDAPTEIYASHDFPLRGIAHIAWSPDSQFLVLTTDSSGGHSPWHSKAFVFAVMGVQDTDAANKGDTFRVRWNKVPLLRKIGQMPRVE